MNRRDAVTALLLGTLVLLSGVVVVKTKHENRTLVHQQERLRAEQARLETEWSQLQLEEATLAHHGRVEDVARKRLDMAEPAEVVVVPREAGGGR